MHIGFDISQTGAQRAGCGQFAHALIGELLRASPGHHYALYPSFGDFYLDAGMPMANPHPLPNVEYGPRLDSIEQARAFWLAADLESRLGHPDVVHANNFWCPPQLAHARLVYTLYDLSFHAHPEWTTEANRAACWEGMSRAAAEADWIVAISGFTRSHFASVFPDFPRERISVVHPCSRFDESRTPEARPAPLAGVDPGGFWLSVGTIEPRKNQRHTAQAYARYLDRGGRRVPLVFAGGMGWLMDDFVQQLEHLGIANNVIVTGYVTDAELAWLYRHCLANLYVSRFEGFGLPVLEAMQFGAPTIASDTTSIPEVAGDAAVLVAPDDLEALSRAMLHLSEDPLERERMAARGRERARGFSARESAKAVLDVYEKVTRLPKHAPKAVNTPHSTSPSGLGRKLYERAIRSLRRS
jgi:glycosyltransferase involved in cell wall biosynthesis